MVDLSQVSADELRGELERVESKTPALRLVAALNHKHGLTQTEIAEQYGVARKTVYNWLTRLESRPIGEAITDDERPGRPPKLSPDEQRRFARLLRESPAAAGYEAEHWTPPLVRTFVSEAFDVEYSLPHVRRLMRENGLAPRDTAWVAERSGDAANEPADR
jgi:transposase